MRTRPGLSHHALTANGVKDRRPIGRKLERARSHWRSTQFRRPFLLVRGRCEKIISLETRRFCILEATRRNEVRDEGELLDERVIEFMPALICWEFLML